MHYDKGEPMVATRKWTPKEPSEAEDGQKGTQCHLKGVDTWCHACLWKPYGCHACPRMLTSMPSRSCEKLLSSVCIITLINLCSTIVEVELPVDGDQSSLMIACFLGGLQLTFRSPFPDRSRFNWPLEDTTFQSRGHLSLVRRYKNVLGYLDDE